MIGLKRGVRPQVCLQAPVRLRTCHVRTGARTRSPALWSGYFPCVTLSCLLVPHLYSIPHIQEKCPEHYSHPHFCCLCRPCHGHCTYQAAEPLRGLRNVEIPMGGTLKEVVSISLLVSPWAPTALVPSIWSAACMWCLYLPNQAHNVSCSILSSQYIFNTP